MKPTTMFPSGGKSTNYANTSKRGTRMVNWKIYTYFGNDLPIGLSKEIPEGVVPPKYVNTVNSKGFLPYVGEFERVYLDEELHTATYEKINQFFGGK